MTAIPNNPTISVVIPTCGREDFLAEAIRSALDQTVPPLEVIVVDDASGLDPGPTIARFDARVRMIRLDTRSGANVARNAGIEAARGDIVALLDDDDVWLPEKTALQIEALIDGKAACLCLGWTFDRPPDRPVAAASVEERLRISTPCGTSGLIARRKALLDAPFDPVLRRAQDWDVFVRLAQRGVLAILEQPLYRRRVGHASISTQVRDQSPAQVYETAAAAHKHRAWLGERAYRMRLARTLLSFISQRRGKLRYVAASLRHAGARATAMELLGRLPNLIRLRPR